MGADPILATVSVPFLDLAAAYDELRDELDAAYQRVMQNGWFILGPEVEAFEREFAEYCGVSECIGVGNGLEALTLMLRALEIGPGDEVIVPGNTYIATWLAVSHVGATPVPVEPVPATHQIDPELVEAAITERTRALIAVHLYGIPAEMPRLAEICEQRGIALLEDAAQSQGAQYRDARCGALGLAAGFSFYPGKNLGAFGDAGAVTTDDGNLAKRIRILRNYGSERKYYNEVKGWNSRLDELQAALLRVKLSHLDAWNARRVELARRYTDALIEIDSLTLPRPTEQVSPVWHQYVVRHAERDRLIEELKLAGVGTLIHYPIPPHLSDAYAGESFPALPISEQLAGEVLSIPIGPHLSAEDQDAVIAALRASA
jgi:dTDP-4-amino-4,6-dideoxygalactose transaminase